MPVFKRPRDNEDSSAVTHISYRSVKPRFSSSIFNISARERDILEWGVLLRADLNKSKQELLLSKTQIENLQSENEILRRKIENLQSEKEILRTRCEIVEKNQITPQLEKEFIKFERKMQQIDEKLDHQSKVLGRWPKIDEKVTSINLISRNTRFLPLSTFTSQNLMRSSSRPTISTMTLPAPSLSSLPIICQQNHSTPFASALDTLCSLV